jgi:hypothetical protein
MGNLDMHVSCRSRHIGLVDIVTEAKKSNASCTIHIQHFCLNAVIALYALVCMSQALAVTWSV